VVLPYFEPGACALQNNLGSYASRRSLISTVWSGRSDEKSRAALGIIKDGPAPDADLPSKKGVTDENNSFVT
jgi:hypothetical protein